MSDFRELLGVVDCLVIMGRKTYRNREGFHTLAVRETPGRGAEVRRQSTTLLPISMARASFAFDPADLVRDLAGEGHLRIYSGWGGASDDQWVLARRPGRPDDDRDGADPSRERHFSDRGPELELTLESSIAPRLRNLEIDLPSGQDWDEAREMVMPGEDIISNISPPSGRTCFGVNALCRASISLLSGFDTMLGMHAQFLLNGSGQRF
jgi:hypothetical protein